MFFYARHRLAGWLDQRRWRELARQQLTLSGAVSRLRLRFLVDYFPQDDGLQTEAGVSYLVQADRARILFDLGFNPGGWTPSPLRANLDALGLADDPLDGVFISHNHLDHVGGSRYQRARTLDLSQLASGTWQGAPLWTPVPMAAGQRATTHLDRPRELLPGVASTGALPAHLYFLGSVPEQALLVSLAEQGAKGEADRGLVLITGCGHPGVLEMARFAREVTGRRVYAVVGGFHLIVSRGRTAKQKVIAANQPPWSLPGPDAARRTLEALRELGVAHVAPSAHDSCDEALGLMREVFGAGYHEVRAGGELEL